MQKLLVIYKVKQTHGKWPWTSALAGMKGRALTLSTFVSQDPSIQLGLHQYLLNECQNGSRNMAVTQFLK